MFTNIECYHRFKLFFFEFVILRLKYNEPMYSLRRSISDREYRGILFLNFGLKLINIFLESRNLLLERWYAFLFKIRAFYWFVFHGIILHRGDSDSDFTQRRVERFDGRLPSLLGKAAVECARTICSAARISARSD